MRDINFPIILWWNGLKKKSPDTYMLKAFDKKDKISNL